jgi:hypothetical protein
VKYDQESPSFALQLANRACSQHATPENFQHATEKLRENVGEIVQGPVGQKVSWQLSLNPGAWLEFLSANPEREVATVVEENKVPLAVTAAGVVLAAAPGIITGPILGVAHLLGFTSSGVAAGKRPLPRPLKLPCRETLGVCSVLLVDIYPN